MIRSEQEVGKLFFLASPTHAITNTTACFQVREGAHTKYNIHDSEPIEILRLKISIPPKPRDTLRRAGCDVDTGRVLRVARHHGIKRGGLGTGIVGASK